MTTPAVGDTWYRLEDHALEYGGVNISCLTFRVVKVTRCGVQLQQFSNGFFGHLLLGGRRFQLSTSRKKYACPTMTAALESFLARKQRQASIYENRAKRARLAMTDAQRQFADHIPNKVLLGVP